MSKVGQSKTAPTTQELEEELRYVQDEYDDTERLRTGTNWSMNQLLKIDAEQLERMKRIVSIVQQLLDRYRGLVQD